MKTFSRFFLFSMLGCLCGAAPAAAFEDVRYEIDARFSAEDKSLTATEAISFVNNSGRPLGEVSLRVYPNHRYSRREKSRLYFYAGYFRADLFPDGFDPGRFEVTDVRAQGQ
jgi:hypothetical protein